MNTKLFRILEVTILIFINAGLSQNNYFISPNGNDTDSGASIDSAFQTLQHAADIVVSGDSVFVLPGNYRGFDLRTGGTSELHIVFKALGDNVIINLPNSETNDGINIENAAWIIIDGFNVVDQPRSGIRIAVSDFVVIKNNYCNENGRWGIFTAFTDDIVIENNICSNSIEEHGIYVSNSSDRPVVRKNHCYGNNGCGLHFNGDESMGGDGIISNAIIEGNILYDNGYGGGSAINMDGVQESLIFNNLIYNNHATGIAMYRTDGAEGSRNNKVYNNTIINPSDSRWGIIAVNGSTGNTLYNNIIINHHSFRGSVSIDESSEENFVSDYNIVVDRLSTDDGESNISLAQWQVLGYDVHSELAQPEEQIFADYSSGDYSLMESSQAVDKGTSLVSNVVTKDITDISRPQRDGFDIGAYEYFDPSGINTKEILTRFSLYQNYPNPFNPATKINYEIGSMQFVILKIFDITGKEIATLVNEPKPAGKYEIEFNASGLASGVYFYKLQAGNYSSTKKLVFLK